MIYLRIRLLAAAAAAVGGAVLAPAAAAQAAPTLLAAEAAPVHVAAWFDTAMWSHFDPATNDYTLMKSVRGGAAEPAGVAPRSGGPFDVDLGINQSASTYAVYTRNGDIYRLNVSTGGEAKLSGLSAPGIAERSPTIMSGQVAFIRRSHGRDELRIGRMTGGSRLLVRKRSIILAELGPLQIAYVETAAGPITDDGRKIVHIRNLRTGADRVVYKATSGGANYADITRPSYVDKPAGFLWARTNNGSGRGNRIVRYTLRGSSLAYAPGSPFYISTSWAGETLGVVTTSALAQTGCDDGPNSRPYCTVELTGPLTFGPRP